SPDCQHLLQQFLQTVADMVSVQRGAIFLRRPGSGRYDLAAHLVHPDWAGNPSFFYESGQGLTGWIVKHNRPLCIANISDEIELRTLAPHLHWQDRVSDTLAREHTHAAYLGEPIAVQDEVFGVIRFANSSKLRFSRSDQRIVCSAAVRLADLFHA